MYKAIIFDMDGTLLDTIPDLQAALIHTTQALEMPYSFTDTETKYCFGGGLRNDMEKALARMNGASFSDLEKIGKETTLSNYGIKEDTLLSFTKTFQSFYASHKHLHTAPYASIHPLLKTLQKKGIHRAIASNKNDRDVRILADQFFPSLFPMTVGNSPLQRRKPYPDMIQFLMETNHWRQEEVVYVGDTEFDIETAKNAGIPCLSVTWGFRKEKDLLRAGATKLLHTPDEILSYLS